MQKTFARLLTEHLERLGISNNAFAKRVGCGQPTISLCKRGQRPPVENKEEAWADGLELKGEERAEFIAVYRKEKAEAQSLARPGIEDQDKRIARLEAKKKELAALLAMLLPFLEEGKKAPKNYLQAIKALLDSI